MTKLISLFNQAGGVCKTTLTMNVGYHLAEKGNRVLLVDADPQASLTTFMGQEPGELESTLADSIIESEPLSILEGIHEMDLVPSNLDLSAAELQLTSVIAREKRLKIVLEPILDEYDFILIDCPPSLGILSINGLVAATHVLIPIQTHYKAYKGTELLFQTLSQIREMVNPNLAIAGIVPTLFVGQASQDKIILASVKEQLSQLAKVFLPIPRATAFADAAMEHKPLKLYQRKHAAIKILDAIAKHLEGI